MLRRLLRDLARIPSIERVVFTGGEPFAFYQHLRLAVQEAAILDLAPAVWTSGVYLIDSMACPAYVKGIVEMGLEYLILSQDEYHPMSFPAERLEDLRDHLRPAELIISSMHPKQPELAPDFARSGGPWLDGPISYAGRASSLVEKEGQALWLPENFSECPHLNLRDPEHILIDAWGNVHICPGIVIGNVRRHPIRRLLAGMELDAHPILSFIRDGGPYGLALQYGVELSEGYADACHLCYSVRSELFHKSVAGLGPAAFYGGKKPS